LISGNFDWPGLDSIHGQLIKAGFKTYNPIFAAPALKKAHINYKCNRGLARSKQEHMYNIQFKFEQKDLKPLVLENVAAGDSILEIALGNHIELHHNCGGVCACSTCHVYIEKGEDFLPELTDREEDFIDRAISPRLNSRLSCQCVLEDGDGEIMVYVPDQRQFLGE
jgi:2Fe-2S ferredoxin